MLKVEECCVRPYGSRPGSLGVSAYQFISFGALYTAVQWVLTRDEIDEEEIVEEGINSSTTGLRQILDAPNMSKQNIIFHCLFFNQNGWL